jgi:DnaJ family protein C protein 2
VHPKRYVIFLHISINRSPLEAYEVLSNPERRRQFDSVDPYYLAIEMNPPEPSQISTPKSFFSIMGPIFELEARFSKNRPHVPLGAEDATKEEVEGFYDYWYNFDSWRSFEYKDKEVNEGSDSRDDKRYTEKKNKSERARLKKEDIARVRGLVDLAMSCDPRIKRIKQEEKAAREAKKKGAVTGKGKQTPANKAEEAAKRAEEERLKKEEEEKARAEAKKAKAAAANAAKKARRAARAEGGEPSAA